jgi:calcineurin-like phosphoesterase family protein
MSEYWLTADWHLGHRAIIDFCDRPFKDEHGLGDVELMNEQLISAYNALVRPGDRVWVLGDACLGQIGRSLALVSRFHGDKYLVAGNHDRCFHGYGRNAIDRAELDRWVKEYRAAGFASVLTGFHTLRTGFGPLLELVPRAYAPGGKRKLPPLNAELSHFPATGESDANRTDRYVDYRPRPLGGVDRRPTTKRWVLHGHVHDRWLSAGRNLNVGVDQWNFAPVHIDQVAAYVQYMEREYGDALDDPATSTRLGPAYRWPEVPR